MAHSTQDHAKEKNTGPGKGWKTKQKAAGVRRDAQLSALTQMVRVLAGDCLRLSAKTKVLEDVLAKRCGITKEDFDASTAAVLSADQGATPTDQAPAPPAPVPMGGPTQTPVVVDTPVATGDALAAA
ncbi:hypothetical protein [Nitrospira defluvii]|uniref:Flagellar hook-length control protein fliK n=1 Tax=Nitrospira defluvii TaxID=330214 RepID=A0ABM8RYR9_9BACT|nr:hypothetical protein [Nitrospira defluvii]CAE6779277.1 Flagellar hook-length control protein fliK [Nitrospira defluvii]